MIDHSNCLNKGLLAKLMGRLPHHSQAETLDACRDLFWRQGYSRSSIKDIEQVTGLKPGSVYHHFKDKQSIFDQSLDHYIDTVIRPRVERFLFTNDGHARNNIEGFFKDIFNVSQKTRYGCLMVNTSIEAPHMGKVQKKLKDMAALLDAGFLFQLNRIKDTKTMSQSDMPMIACQLTLINQGFWSMVRIADGNKNIKNYIDCISHLIR